jgi:membrane protein CcdC involved in cytochrome C biogenesis
MNRMIRQIHRWLSILFTIGVIANIVTIFGMGQEQPAVWVGMMALIPLVLLLVTGLYMFALPYFARSGARRITPAK